MENANKPTDIDVSDERVLMTLMEDGTIEALYSDGTFGYWKNYHDMIGDRDLATKLARKIRSRAPHLV